MSGCASAVASSPASSRVGAMMSTLDSQESWRAALELAPASVDDARSTTDASSSSGGRSSRRHRELRRARPGARCLSLGDARRDEDGGERRSVLMILREKEEVLWSDSRRERELREKEEEARAELRVQRREHRLKEIDALVRTEGRYRAFSDAGPAPAPAEDAVLVAASCPLLPALADASAPASAAPSQSDAPSLTRSASTLAMDRERAVEEFLRAYKFPCGVNGAKKTWFQFTYPLHCAAKIADARMVSLLLRAGADATLRDSQGHLAIQVARALNDEDSHTLVLRVLSRHVMLGAAVGGA